MKKEIETLLKLSPVMTAPFFIAGMAAAYFGGIIACIAVLVLTSAAAVLLIKKRKRMVLCAIGGFAGACVMLIWTCFTIIPAQSYVGKAVKTQYTITEIISTTSSFSTYRAQAKIGGLSVGVRLSGTGEVAEGEKVCALVEYSALDDEYKTHSHAQNIMLVGEVKELYSVSDEFSIYKTLAKIRAHAKDMLSTGLESSEESLAMAMLLGDTSKLSLSQTEFMRISGVSHYSAVSGTHFSILIAIILPLLPQLSKRIRSTSMVAFILLAAVFFGGSLSVVRSAVMLAICFISDIFGSKSVMLNSLCVAVIIICTISPGAMLDAGFQMSVMGAFGAGFVGKEITEMIDERLPLSLAKLLPLIKAITISACAVICTSPFCIAYYGGVSALGAFTTIIIAPLFICAAVVGVLYFATGIGVFAGVLGWIMRTMSSIIRFFGKMRTGWLDMRFFGAVFLSVICVIILVGIALYRNSYSFLKVNRLALVTAFALFMCFFNREYSNCVEIISDGTSGAAIHCEGRIATVLISGSGSKKLVSEIAERLDRNGICGVRAIYGEQVSSDTAHFLAELTDIVIVGEVCVSGTTKYTSFADNVHISDKPKGEITFGNRTISTAKSGSKEKGDIVLYYGYKRSVPDNNANIAIYASSQQKLLPENGVNTYGMVYTIKIRAKKGG